MMNYKILVESAKSNKSTCKNCSALIQKGAIRVKVVDPRKFNAYIKEHGGRQNLSGEGMYRGYIEDSNGIISIEKYFVHLECYQSIEPHPFTPQYFKMEGLTAHQKILFQQWLSDRSQAQGLSQSESSSHSPDQSDQASGKKNINGDRPKPGMKKILKTKGIIKTKKK